MKRTTREQRLRQLDVLYLQVGETPPSTARARRIRQVEVLRLGADLPAAIPSKEARREKRMREVEVLAIDAGVPLPRRSRGRGPSEQIDLVPLVAAFEASRAKGHRQYEAFGLSADAGGRQVRCRRCGEVVVSVKEGQLVGMTPSTIFVMHARATGCR